MAKPVGAIGAVRPRGVGDRARRRVSAQAHAAVDAREGVRRDGPGEPINKQCLREWIR